MTDKPKRENKEQNKTKPCKIPNRQTQQVVDLTETEQISERNNDPYQRLLTTQYLDDRIINDTLKLIFQNQTTQTYLNTYFYNNLINYGARDRSTQRGIAKLHNPNIKKWYIPICRNQHWYHIQIQRDNHTITQVDSLNTRTQHFGNNIQSHLRNPQDWTLKFKNMATQRNSYDCGAYLLAEIYSMITQNQQFQGQPSRRKIYEYVHQVQIHTNFQKQQTQGIPISIGEIKLTKPESNKTAKNASSNKKVDTIAHGKTKPAEKEQKQNEPETNATKNTKKKTNETQTNQHDWKSKTPHNTTDQ